MAEKDSSAGLSSLLLQRGEHLASGDDAAAAAHAGTTAARWHAAARGLEALLLDARDDVQHAPVSAQSYKRAARRAARQQREAAPHSQHAADILRVRHAVKGPPRHPGHAVPELGAVVHAHLQAGGSGGG